MRLHCWFCQKSVSSEVHHSVVVRATLVCPECIQAGKVIIPEIDEEASSRAVGTEDVLISPMIQGVPTKGTTIPLCTSCSGTGRVEDPHHGHDMRCEPCSGTGRRKK